MKRALTILWIVVLAAGLSLTGGCAVVESQDVKTSGMWAHFVIDHHPDDDVVAWAVLRVGGQAGTIIDLVGDDYMECNGVRMTGYVEVVTNFHWNRAEISPDAHGTYEFKFIRSDEEVSSIVRTPSIPTIASTTPANTETVNAGTRIEVTWDKSDPGEHVNFFVWGTCIKDIWDLENLDDGEHVLPELADSDPQNPTDCTVSLELRRWIEGDVSAEFKGGYTEAKRMDGVTFDYE
jgi:hypothetical protein